MKRRANILAELEAEGEIHVALVYRGTAENAQKFISAQEKYLTELAAENEKENKNIGKPEVSQKTSESEVAENNTSEDNSRENNSEIDKVIIDPESNSDDNSDSNSETEVTSDAESV